MTADAPPLIATVPGADGVSAEHPDMVWLECPRDGCHHAILRNRAVVAARPGEHLGCPGCGLPCTYPTTLPDEEAA